MSLQIPAFAFLFPGGPMVNSLLATAYISLIPNLLLYFVPPQIQPASLRTLVSFAVGGLLGDVFLHLLPHAFGGGHSHGGGGGHHHHHHHHGSGADGGKNNKQHVLIGLGIFSGFFFFFAMDKMMRMLNGGSGHCHDHSTHQATPGIDNDQQQQPLDNNTHHEGLRQRKKDSNTTVDDNNEPAAVNHHTIKLTAYLNLLADFVHNFTDGLAMAASFYASPAVGATTAVAVFFHEIPHEIGDYALLLQSGFSKQRAMMAQFTTAGGAFLGTLMGIFIEQVAATTAGGHHHHHRVTTGLAGTRLQWPDLVIPMTAGGFIYIASVGVIPDLLDGQQRNKVQVGMEFAAMGVGMAVMAAIAWNEV